MLGTPKGNPQATSDDASRTSENGVWVERNEDFRRLLEKLNGRREENEELQREITKPLDIQQNTKDLYREVCAELQGGITLSTV